MEYVVARVSQQGRHHLLSDESSVAAAHRPTPVVSALFIPFFRYVYLYTYIHIYTLIT
jgi:hypothetical protein